MVSDEALSDGLLTLYSSCISSGPAQCSVTYFVISSGQR